jgi:hypothetical protein
VLSLCLTTSAIRHEDAWGSGRIDPHSLDLATRWGWMVSFTPRPLYPRGNSPGTHWIGDWVGPTTGLDYMEKWKFLQHRNSISYPLVVQTVASRYTNCANPALKKTVQAKTKNRGIRSSLTILTHVLILFRKNLTRIHNCSNNSIKWVLKSFLY